VTKELRLALLGGVAITRGGEPVTGFISAKAQALLCYLAMSGRTHQRSALAGLLWGELAEEKAAAGLRVALSNLRKLVGPHLAITRQAVAFDRGGPYWLDVECFRAAASSEDITSLGAAIALYRGDLLEGFYVHDAPAFEEWLAALRERLRTQATQALHTLIEHHTTHGQYQAAIDFASRLLALEPWREEAHHQMMLLLARTGQRGAALAQYETCRRALAQELGVEPSPQTVRLYERIKASRAIPAHNLPPAPTPFIGREEELAAIRHYLAHPDCRLLTVVGLGGVGKTRLALQAAGSVAAETARFFLHGVRFIPLVGVASADLLVSIIANALNLAFRGQAPAETQLLGYLREKEMLLLLDNYEHLLPHTALLERILEAAPEVKLLVTSRQRLNLPQERLFELEGLPYPERDEASCDVERLSAFSAVDLFESSARRTRRRFSLHGTWRDVTQICQLVEGMPLALELAAGRLATLGCAEVVQEIQLSLDFLTGGWDDVPDRHRSLRAVFEASWAALTAAERAAMRQVSVFRGGFDRAAAAEVAGANGPLLDALVDKSLLHLAPSGRYEVHELLRQYAAEKLAAEPTESEATRTRHGRYYTTFLAQREQPMKGPRQPEILAEIRAEMANVRAAWQWAVGTGDLEAVGQTLEALYFVYEYPGRYQELQVLFDQAQTSLAWLDETEPQQGLLKGRLQMWASHLAGRLGHFEEYKSLAQSSLKLLRQYGPPREIAIALLGLDYALSLLGDLAEARRCSLEALRLMQRGDDIWWLTFATGNRGLIAARQGETGWAEAEHYLHLAESYTRQLGDPWLLTGIQRLLGELYLRQGKLQAARQHFLTGLGLARQTRYRWDEEFALLRIGQIAQQMGELSQARQYCEEGALLAREIGDRHELATAHYHLGQVCRAEGALKQAEQQLQTSLALRHEIDDRPGIAACLEALAEVAAALGQIDAARQYQALAGQAQAALEAEGAPATERKPAGGG
jgi:predicted ATPase/DNA-binding SARP family transcriptional activator